MISIKVTPSLERDKKAWYLGYNAFKKLVLIAFTTFAAFFATLFSIVTCVSDGGPRVIVVFGALVTIKGIFDFFRLKNYPEKHFKSEHERVPDKVCHYTFDDEISTFEEKGTGSFVRSEYKYSVYKKAVYSEGWFVLKFERNTIVFNDKDFEEGTPEQLRALLREKFGDDFEENDI